MAKKEGIKDVTIQTPPPYSPDSCSSLTCTQPVHNPNEEEEKECKAGFICFFYERERGSNQLYIVHQKDYIKLCQRMKALLTMIQIVVSPDINKLYSTLKSYLGLIARKIPNIAYNNNKLGYIVVTLDNKQPMYIVPEILVCNAIKNEDKEQREKEHEPCGVYSNMLTTLTQTELPGNYDTLISTWTSISQLYTTGNHTKVVFAAPSISNGLSELVDDDNNNNTFPDRDLSGSIVGIGQRENDRYRYNGFWLAMLVKPVTDERKHYECRYFQKNDHTEILAGEWQLECTNNEYTVEASRHAIFAFDLFQNEQHPALVTITKEIARRLMAAFEVYKSTHRTENVNKDDERSIMSISRSVNS
jgi:hypothetical protein